MKLLGSTPSVQARLVQRLLLNATAIVSIEQGDGRGRQPMPWKAAQTHDGLPRRQSAATRAPAGEFHFSAPPIADLFAAVHAGYGTHFRLPAVKPSRLNLSL
ncbi:hypothetical protein ACFLIM_47590 [Nonomuraea sp. M3C6]|uniref:Uncharacterized protein n=1 Tax=Nonomuraea marmarensis TaxID=3351344 RepID=A0ABW7AX94_9ACTN